MPGILRAAGAVALTLSLLAPTAAYADRWSSTDAERDVVGWHYDPEPPPCGTDTEVDGTAEANTDITRLTVRHTRRAVVVTTQFRNLARRLEQSMWVYVRTDVGGWWLHLSRYMHGSGWWKVHTFLAEEPRLPDPDDIEDECGGVGIGMVGIPCRITRSVEFDTDRIWMAVPRTCIDNPRWVRVGTSAHRFVEPEDPGDASFTVFSDDWDGGTKLSYWMPPFGPRVPATRGAQIGTTQAEQATGDRRHVVVQRGGIFTRR